MHLGDAVDLGHAIGDRLRVGLRVTGRRRCAATSIVVESRKPAGNSDCRTSKPSTDSGLSRKNELMLKSSS